VQAVGDHGCQRDVKNGGFITAKCDNPRCVDCITREYIDKLKAASAYFSTTGDNFTVGYASLTHWPGQNGSVRDNLLTGQRSGSF
jgi:predicted PP-loop superfamily ATPase